MRTFVLLVPLMLVGVTANSQSGRKAPKTIPQPTPAVEETNQLRLQLPMKH
jgi:hypothetical protein